MRYGTEVIYSSSDKHYDIRVDSTQRGGGDGVGVGVGLSQILFLHLIGGAHTGGAI